jgi:hypothetical protein
VRLTTRTHIFSLVSPFVHQAYAYYEHITLPRRFVGDQQGGHVLRRAEPGENEALTELYSPLLTPSSSFIEWGVGIDLYFSTVRIMSMVLLVAGLINIPLIAYYRSSDYSANGQGSLYFSLQGSAICTTLQWVVCSDCQASSYGNGDEKDRFGVAADGTTLVLRNDCDGANLAQGMVNLATFFFLSVVMALFSFYLTAREVRFDEDK